LPRFPQEDPRQTQDILIKACDFRSSGYCQSKTRFICPAKEWGETGG